RNGPTQRVFAPPRTDDQHLHPFDPPRVLRRLFCGILRTILARDFRTVTGTTEANLSTGKQKRADRSGATVKRFDAACRQISPALWAFSGRGIPVHRQVALRRPSGSSKSSTVVPATLFGFLLPGRTRRDAMVPREGAGIPGWQP